jgi:hypothetical protein
MELDRRNLFLKRRQLIARRTREGAKYRWPEFMAIWDFFCEAESIGTSKCKIATICMKKRSYSDAIWRHSYRRRRKVANSYTRTIIFANCSNGTFIPIDEKCLQLTNIFLHIDPAKEWFTAKEVAALLGRTDQFVRDLLEHRRLLGHALCGRGESPRKSYQIHRKALELYLLQTANFQPEEYVQRICQLLRRLPREQRERIKECF